MQRQAGEILGFDEEQIRVFAGRKVVEEFIYAEIKRMRYQHFPKPFSRAFQVLSGNLFGRKEAVIRLDFETGRIHEFYLEADLEFREADLRKLFRGLYTKGLNLEEYSSNGNRLFLLETATQIEIEAQILALAELKENE
ncbi:MAG TPA: hypothetical protein ENJ82_17300 [Bacteroidetes bacterium]|nr:hypothetical protein [Bacteroidota bacterium]